MFGVVCEEFLFIDPHNIISKFILKLELDDLLAEAFHFRLREVDLRY